MLFGVCTCWAFIVAGMKVLMWKLSKGLVSGWWDLKRHSSGEMLFGVCTCWAFIVAGMKVLMWKLSKGLVSGWWDLILAKDKNK